jgi:hypothetical protein
MAQNMNQLTTLFGLVEFLGQPLELISGITVLVYLPAKHTLKI